MTSRSNYFSDRGRVGLCHQAPSPVCAKAPGGFSEGRGAFQGPALRPPESPGCTAAQALLPDAGRLTLVHGRGDRPTDAQGTILMEGLAEVLQHGHAQAPATVSPPDKHSVEDRQQVARTCAIAAQAACKEGKRQRLPSGLLQPARSLAPAGVGLASLTEPLKTTPQSAPHHQLPTSRRRPALGSNCCEHGHQTTVLTGEVSLVTEQSQAAHAHRCPSPNMVHGSQQPLDPGWGQETHRHVSRARTCSRDSHKGSLCPVMANGTLPRNRPSPASQKTPGTSLSRAEGATVAPPFPLSSLNAIFLQPAPTLGGGGEDDIGTLSFLLSASANLKLLKK